MDGLPPELLHSIFRLACTDGGKTASALLRVSRQIGGLARTHRFGVVAVTGTKAIAGLVDALDRAPSDARVVEHLFVTDWSGEGDPGKPLERYVDGAEAKQIEALVGALVRHAAPNLRTFTLLLLNGAFIAPLKALEEVVFPVLTQLVLDCPWFTPSPSQTLPARLDLPALRTVTIVLPLFVNAVDIHALLFIQRLVVLFPSVRHIVLHNALPVAPLFRILSMISLNSIAANGVQLGPDVQWIFHQCVPRNTPGIHPGSILPEMGESYNDVENILVHPPVQDLPSYTQWREEWMAGVYADALE